MGYIIDIDISSVQELLSELTIRIIKAKTTKITIRTKIITITTIMEVQKSRVVLTSFDY